jgi:hypothetical protein
VWTAAAAVALIGALWVSADGPGTVHAAGDAMVATARAVPPAQAPALPAVLVAVAALVLGAVSLRGRRAEPRPVPVPVRANRGRGPPRPPST